MRVLYLHQYFNTPEMPGGTRSYELARRLVSAGHEVDMITSQWQTKKSDKKTWFQTNESGINVHWLPLPYSNKMSYRNRIKVFFKFALLAGPKARSIGADVVFATSTPLTIILPAIYAAKKNDIPLIFEVRDLWPEIPIAVGALKNPLAIFTSRLLERFAYRKSTHIIALSPGIKTGITTTGYPETQVTMIPNSSDLDLFDVDRQAGLEVRRQHKWLGQRPLVAYTGTLGLVNGLEYLVRLAKATLAINPEIRFVVIGSGREENKVRHKAEQSGVLGVNFFMVPDIPKHEIPKWLSAADIATSLFIDLEALWANSANKFFDALAAGKPIAINYGGWQANLIQEANAGLVLTANDPTSSAKVLAKAVTDKHWLATAGESARRLAVDHFDRDKLASKLEKVLSRAFQPKKAHTSRFQKTIKRAMDLVLAIAGLLLAAPFTIVVALIIRISLGSPVIFRQTRPGLHKTPFTIYKFRTMISTLDKNDDLLPDKERLTRLGIFLRNHSLDEIPEFFNVIKGDMSLVGPRPLLTSYLERYTSEQQRRHQVKPGITGWAQINGRNALSWPDKFKLDLWYVDNCSLWLDIKILLMTLIKVLRKEGINAQQHATMPEFKGDNS